MQAALPMQNAQDLTNLQMVHGLLLVLSADAGLQSLDEKDLLVDDVRHGVHETDDRRLRITESKCKK